MRTPTSFGDAFLAFCIFLTVCIISAIVLSLNILPSPWNIGVLMAVFILLTVAVTRWRRHDVIRQSRMLVTTGAKADIRHTLEAIGNYVAPSYAGPIAATVAKALVDCRRVGTTGRIRCTNTHLRIDPLTINFEPLLLEESDGAFQAMRSSIEMHNLTDQSLRHEQSEWVRKIKRSIRLHGGIWIVAMCVFNLLVATFEAFQQSRITWRLAWWGFITMLFFFNPVHSWLSTKQWHLVPGGLLLRTARMFDTRSKLHIFDRRSASLILLELRRRNWVAGVADAKGDSAMTLTESEADMLLRAWLSPLQPPNVERLTDFQ